MSDVLYILRKIPQVAFVRDCGSNSTCFDEVRQQIKCYMIVIVSRRRLPYVLLEPTFVVDARVESKRVTRG